MGDLPPLKLRFLFGRLSCRDVRKDPANVQRLSAFVALAPSAEHKPSHVGTIQNTELPLGLLAAIPDLQELVENLTIFGMNGLAKGLPGQLGFDANTEHDAAVSGRPEAAGDSI